MVKDTLYIVRLISNVLMWIYRRLRVFSPAAAQASVLRAAGSPQKTSKHTCMLSHSQGPSLGPSTTSEMSSGVSYYSCVFLILLSHFYRKCRPLVSQMDIYVYLMLNIKQLFEKELMAFTSAIVAVMLTTDLLYCFKMLRTLHQRNVQHNIIYRMRTYFRSACVPVKNWFHALWAVHEQQFTRCLYCNGITQWASN